MENKGNLPTREEIEAQLDEMEREIGSFRGRKLGHNQKCAIVAVLLRRPFLRPAIGQRFNISQTTISHLSQCVRGRPEHYIDIYKEYAQMGEEAFVEKYYDLPLHNELIKIMMDNNLYTRRRRQRWSAEVERREAIAKEKRIALGLDS